MFTVLVAKVALFAQSVQRSDCCGINGECVRQALDGGLVVPWFAGGCSVTEPQKCGICCCTDGGIGAVKTGFGAVFWALRVLNPVLRYSQHFPEQFFRKRHLIELADPVQIDQWLRVHWRFL